VSTAASRVTEHDSGTLRLTVTIYNKNFSPHIYTQSTFCGCRNVSNSTSENTSQLEMWANAQRDGRPAEYRWRPLFNAAVWLMPTTRVPCSNDAKTRNPLKLPGVPQTNEMISAASGPKFTILWGPYLTLPYLWGGSIQLPALRPHSRAHCATPYELKG